MAKAVIVFAMPTSGMSTNNRFQGISAHWGRRLRPLVLTLVLLVGGSAMAAPPPRVLVLSGGPDRTAAASLAEALRIQLGALAECAQAQGRIDQAVAAYAAVAERFGDLPAGETALFTAARTLADAARPAAASWLHRYLDRYPNGRFTVEAKERVAELEGSRP